MEQLQLPGQIGEVLETVALGGTYAFVPGHVLYLEDVVCLKPTHDHAGADLPVADNLRIDPTKLPDGPCNHLAGFFYRKQVLINIPALILLHLHQLPAGRIQVDA
jgi:hypothetical protein